MSMVEEFIRDPRLSRASREEFTARDKALMRIWLNGSLSESELGEAIDWWKTSREEDQELVEFFIVHQILLRSAGVALEQIAAGVPIGDGVSLFTGRGRELLQEQLVDVRSRLASESQGSGSLKTPIRQTRLGRRSGRNGSSVLNRNATRAKQPAPSTKTTGRTLPRVGTQFGRCLLTEPIGDLQGGGFLFRALHRTLNMCVLVKMFSEKELGHDAGLVEKFTENAQRLAGLHHPHLQRVWECESCEGFTYVVLEQVDGLSLKELIRQSGRIRSDRAIPLIAQTAEGLAFAAEAGMPHRDVRPRNVLLTREGVVKLAGLDVACLKTDSLGPGEADSPQSAIYAAPETSLAHPQHDIRSDIYSLGVTFYHAITGRVPFQGDSRMDVMLKHLREEATPPHLVRAGIDPSVSDVIFKMLAKQVEERHATFRELGAALIDLEGDLLSRTQQARTPPKKGGAASAQRDAWQMLLHRYGSQS